jgi:hypothetical protein
MIVREISSMLLVIRHPVIRHPEALGAERRASKDARPRADHPSRLATLAPQDDGRCLLLLK